MQQSLFPDGLEYRISPVGGLVSPLAEKLLPQSNWKAPVHFPDLTKAKIISFDIETKDPDLKKLGPGFVRKNAHIAGVSVATDDGFFGYYPVRHDGGGNLAPNVVFPWLREVLKTDVPKLGANLLYDLEGLHFDQVKVGGPCYDIQVAEALIEEEKPLQSTDGAPIGYSLDALAWKYLGKRKDEALLKTLQGLLRVTDIKGLLYKLPARFVGPYAEADARLPLEIFVRQQKILREQKLEAVFELETRLIQLLLKMRLKGVRIDYDAADRLNEELKKEIVVKLKEIKRQSGVEVNVWKNESLVRVCDKLGISYMRTAAGNPSFVKDWLSNHEHPVMKMVVDIRTLEKMQRDFVKGLVMDMSYDGRIYTQFHSTRRDDSGTRSGRLSSSNPNLQQTPARHKRFKPLIRGMFIPEHGCQWGCYDYSSQEPRLTIHFAALANLEGADRAVKQFNENPRTDYHQMTADMAGIERKPAKTMNLGLTYGMGQRKLALDLGYMSVEEFNDSTCPVPVAAKELFERYHRMVPYVKNLTEQCANLAANRGYIKTILGRRRHFDLYEPAKFRSKDGQGKARALPLNQARDAWPNVPLIRAYTYKAANGLIQGSAADMMKKAMVDLLDAGYVPHLTVHDEVDDSVNSSKQHKDYQEILINAIKLKVPVLVDASLTANWGEAE